ncbi:MAG: SCO family protein, partial [Opitutales bacterium]
SGAEARRMAAQGPVALLLCDLHLPDVGGGEQQAARREAGRAGKVHLASVSFDPAYDSPGILRSYADAMGLDLAQHRLLTGDARQIKDLMAQCGIQTIQADGTIVHNAATLLVSPEGRIVARIEGPRFDPADILPLLRRELGDGR